MRSLIHFNTGQHYLNNFNFCIFKTGLSDNIERKSAEKDLIIQKKMH
jgi:hypothetical protein